MSVVNTLLEAISDVVSAQVAKEVTAQVARMRADLAAAMGPALMGLTANEEKPAEVPAPRAPNGATASALLVAMKNGRSYRLSELATALDVSMQCAGSALGSLIGTGHVVKIDRGIYRLARGRKS